MADNELGNDRGRLESFILTALHILCTLIGMGSKTYYDVKGAAEYASVTRHTIYAWIHKGVGAEDGGRLMLPVRIVDGMIQINEIDLDNYLDALGYEYDEDASAEDAPAEG